MNHKKLYEVIEGGGGTPFYLPVSPFDHSKSKLSSLCSLSESRYVVIGGNPSSGKTSFAEGFLILNYYLYYKANPDTAVKPYFIVRSMERSEVEKYAKWLAWFIFAFEKKIYSDSMILQRTNAERPLHEGDFKLFRKYEEILDDLSNYLDLVPGYTTGEQVIKYAKNAAMRFGSLVEASDKDVFVNNQKVGEINQTEKRGEIVKHYWEGQFGRIYQQERKYFKNPDAPLMVHLLDHIGKLKRSNGSKKEDIDTYSNEAANLMRDVCQFLWIEISQLNRDNMSTMRQLKQDLDFKISDLKDSGTPAENADLILGVGSPFLDKEAQSWEGYRLNDFIVHEGKMRKERLRVIFCPKNTHGATNWNMPMLMLGENMYMREIPLPERDDPFSDQEFLTDADYARIMRNEYY